MAGCITRPARRRGEPGHPSRSTRVVAALCLAAASAAPLAARDPGQWSWDATVGISQRGYENSVDGRQLNDVEQQELNLSFGINGFIVHPAIAAFRLAADLLLTEVDGRSAFDSDRAGFGADLNLIPYGAFPVRLFAKRSRYDYARPGTDDPFTLVGAPDRGTRWGGDFRVARGPLTGVQAGFERATVDFLDPAADREVLDRQFLTWSRAAGDFRHRVRFEHNRRDYGTVDLEIDDLVAHVDERGSITPTWKWEMYGSGLRRDLAAGAGPGFRTDVYRLRNRFHHTVRERDVLDLRVILGLTEFDTGDRTDSRALSAFYRWRPRPAWEIAPFVSWADQSSGALGVTSPRVGTSVTWRRAAGTLETVLGGQASYGIVDSSGFVGAGKRSEIAASLTGSLAHGVASGLRKELDFEVAHDVLRLTQDLALHLPDLGLPRSEIGTEDYYRARVTLGRQWDSSQLNGWGEWNLRESTDALLSGDFESETVSGTLQLAGPGFGVQASGGQTAVRQAARDDQDVSFLGATAWWRPWRYGTVRATYRTDDRRFELTPDIDVERYEAGVVVRFGRLVLDVHAYESTERLSGGSARTNEGLNWSLSTRFGGLLPVITGTKRRGVIR